MKRERERKTEQVEFGASTWMSLHPTRLLILVINSIPQIPIKHILKMKEAMDKTLFQMFAFAVTCFHDSSI